MQVHWLFVAFAAIAVLVAVEGIVALHVNRNVEYELEHLSGSSLVEVRAADGMALELERALGAARASRPEETRAALDRFHRNLEEARDAAGHAAELAARAGAEGVREEELAEIRDWLEPMAATFARLRPTLERAAAGDLREIDGIERRFATELLDPLSAFRRNSQLELDSQLRAVSAQATRATVWVWGSSVAILAAALALGYFVSAANARSIREREEAGQRLRGSLREKETLLREVQHRVKNNLQVVSSLLEMQAAEVGDAVARGMLSDLCERVGAMALLHEQLCRAPDVGHVDARSYFEELVGHLSRSHGATPIGLEAEGLENVSFSTDQLLACGLIVNELTLNAVKHARGDVEVRLRCRRGAIDLEVSDGGPGVPEDRPSGLGLALVEALARDLGGTLEVASTGQTTARVRVPIPGPAPGRSLGV